MMACPRKKVVIVGGGIAGLTIANTLIEKAKDSVEVTVITRDRHYIGGPTRPLLLTNEEEYGRIIRGGYEEIGLRGGVNVVTGDVISIDPNNRVVNYTETLLSNRVKSLSYDYLVLAPGVVFDGSSINGYDKYWYMNANVYDPGRVHVLKNRVWNINGGTVVVYAPKAPYRCAPPHRRKPRFSSIQYLSIGVLGIRLG